MSRSFTTTKMESSSHSMWQRGPAHEVITSTIRTAAGSIPTYIESPWDVARARSLTMTLYDKRVHPPWYQRYFKTLPMSNKVSAILQPPDEVEHRDYDMAIGKYLGFDHPCLTNSVVAHSEQCNQIRWQVFQRQLREIEVKDRQRRKQQQEFEKRNPRVAGFRHKKIESKSSSNLMWFTKKEQDVVSDAIDAFATHQHKKRFVKLVRNKAKKKFISPDSKWVILRSRPNRRKLVKEYRLARAATRFRTFIHSFIWINIFCRDLLKKVRNPYAIFADLDLSVKVTGQGGFDSSVYAVQQQMRPHIMTTLTTPWRNRKMKDIQEVIDEFQEVHAFAAMPPMFQGYLACVGWFVSVPDKTAIVRQGQKAENFYIVLSGAVMVTRLVGSPIYGEYGEKEYLKTYNRYEMFGEETLSAAVVRREYDAHALGQTCLLAIPRDDYHQVSLDTEWNDLEPEHLTLTRIVLDGMDFPVSKKPAIYAAGNVVYHFFANGATITGNARTAEWVFIVSSGTVLGLSLMDENLIDQLFDKHARRRATLETFTPGTFELSIKKAFASVDTDVQKKVGDSAPSEVAYNPKGTLVELQTKYIIQKTKNIWGTLSHKEQERILSKQNPEKLNEYLQFLLQPGGAGGSKNAQDNMGLPSTIRGAVRVFEARKSMSKGGKQVQKYALRASVSKKKSESYELARGRPGLGIRATPSAAPSGVLRRPPKVSERTRPHSPSYQNISNSSGISSPVSHYQTQSNNQPLQSKHGKPSISAPKDVSRQAMGRTGVNPSGQTSGQTTDKGRTVVESNTSRLAGGRTGQNRTGVESNTGRTAAVGHPGINSSKQTTGQIVTDSSKQVKSKMGINSSQSLKGQINTNSSKQCSSRTDTDSNEEESMQSKNAQSCRISTYASRQITQKATRAQGMLPRVKSAPSNREALQTIQRASQSSGTSSRVKSASSNREAMNAIKEVAHAQGTLSRVKSAQKTREAFAPSLTQVSSSRIFNRGTPSQDSDGACRNRNNSAIHRETGAAKPKKHKSQKGSHAEDPRIKKSQKPTVVSRTTDPQSIELQRQVSDPATHREYTKLKKGFSTPQIISRATSQDNLRLSPYPHITNISSASELQKRGSPALVRSRSDIKARVSPAAALQPESDTSNSRAASISDDGSVPNSPNLIFSPTSSHSDASQESAFLLNILEQVKTSESSMPESNKGESSKMSLNATIPEDSALVSQRPSDTNGTPANKKTRTPSRVKRELKGVFTKGSTMGFEWLNMNDGKYRPSKEDYSLVSKGAAVIMVRKEMLLRAYRF